MNKSSIFYISIFTLIILFFSSCKKDEEVPPVIRTIQDVQSDFSDIDISEGVHDETLQFLNGKFWDFRVIAPQTSGTQNYPLIINLHGSASSGDADIHKSTECLVEPGFENMDVFIISPNSKGEVWNSFNNQEMVINLVLLARDIWPIDLDKIVVTGYSDGGNGSWFFGETQPDLFVAVIPMASSYPTISTSGAVRVMPNPMYVIHGENDDLFPVADTQNWVDQTNNAGSDVTLVIAPGLVHNEPCTYVSYLQDAVTWLADEIW
jgi:predicted peptidase